MGVNRIVMQNGVVWWLPPLRARDDTGRKAPRSTRRSGSGVSHSAPQTPPGPFGPPPTGFVPLSALGIPGLESMMARHAEIYREAYERAIRRRPEGAAPPPADPAGPDAAEGVQGA